MNQLDKEVNEKNMTIRQLKKENSQLQKNANRISVGSQTKKVASSYNDSVKCVFKMLG